MHKPWYYLTWAPPRISSCDEITLTKITRRRGLYQMTLLFWGCVTDRGRFTPDTLCRFAAANMTGLVCIVGYLTSSQLIPESGLAASFAWMGFVWLAGLCVGTLRYISWLLRLLYRCPPLRSATTERSR
jgi:hypothetical protein